MHAVSKPFNGKPEVQFSTQRLSAVKRNHILALKSSLTLVIVLNIIFSSQCVGRKEHSHLLLAWAR